jgi:hypothetical protein
MSEVCRNHLCGISRVLHSLFDHELPTVTKLYILIDLRDLSSIPLDKSRKYLFYARLEICTAVSCVRLSLVTFV